MKEVSTVHSKRKEWVVFSIFFAALLYMALFNQWEYDEAWSYLGIRHCSILEIFNYSKFPIANSHLFNSLYFRLLQVMGVQNVFFYRLISLASAVLFFYSTSAILKYFKVEGTAIIFILLSPLLIYFALGRGYALAIAAFSMSFLSLLRYIDNPSVKQEYSIILWGIVSTLAIFSFLYAFMAIVLLFLFYKRKNLFTIHTLVLGLLSLAVLLYVYKIGKLINTMDPVIIGGPSLFKNGTLSSIVTELSYFHIFFEDSYYKYIKIATILCMIAPLLFLRTGLRQGRVPLILFVLVCIMMTAAFKLAGAKYPMGRAINYLIYIFLIYAAIATARISQNRVFLLPLIVLTTISLVVLGIRFSWLQRPDVAEILQKSNNGTLFVYSPNPAVSLIHEQKGQGGHPFVVKAVWDQLKAPIAADSSQHRYLLYEAENQDSVTVKVNKISKCQGDLIFSEIIN